MVKNETASDPFESICDLIWERFVDPLVNILKLGGTIFKIFVILSERFLAACLNALNTSRSTVFSIIDTAPLLRTSDGISHWGHLDDFSVTGFLTKLNRKHRVPSDCTDYSGGSSPQCLILESEINKLSWKWGNMYKSCEVFTTAPKMVLWAKCYSETRYLIFQYPAGRPRKDVWNQIFRISAALVKIFFSAFKFIVISTMRSCSDVFLKLALVT